MTHLYVKGYTLCGCCEKGVHVGCTKPCDCDLCDEGAA